MFEAFSARTFNARFMARKPALVPFEARSKKRNQNARKPLTLDEFDPAWRELADLEVVFAVKESRQKQASEPTQLSIYAG